MPASESGPDVAAGLIAELDRETALVERGGFTLDQALAREKLAGFRLATPDLFAVLLVEVGELLGASLLSFADEGGALIVRLDQVELSGAELRRLLDAVFVRRAELEPALRRRVEAMRLLAVCVETVAATGQVFELAAVAEGGALELLEAREDAAGELRTQVSAPDPNPALTWPGHELRVVVRVSGKPKTWAPGARGSFRARARLVRERCRYASVPVVVGRERVSIGPQLPELDRAVEHLPTQVHAAGWSPARRVATVLFLAHGVIVEAVELDGAKAGLLALVDADELERDLSLFKLRRDAGYEARIRAARAALDQVEAGPAPTLAPVSVGNHIGSDLAAGLLIAGCGIGGAMAMFRLFGAFATVIGLVVLLFSLIAVAKSALVIRRALKFGAEAALLMRGLEATATILELRPAPFPHAGQDMIVARVRLHRPGQRSTETEIEMWQQGGVGATKLRVGTPYLARVDPDDPRNAVLEPLPWQVSLRGEGPGFRALPPSSD